MNNGKLSKTPDGMNAQRELDDRKGARAVWGVVSLVFMLFGLALYLNNCP